MNVDRIKRNVESQLGSVEYGGSRVLDNGLVRLNVKTGREVTESMIEADYHSTHFETDEKHVVIAKQTGEIQSITSYEEWAIHVIEQVEQESAGGIGTDDMNRSDLIDRNVDRVAEEEHLSRNDLSLKVKEIEE